MKTKPYKLHFLLHSADLLEERLRIQLSPLGIRPRQARILMSMKSIGPVSQVALAREFDITSASMSTMTQRLISAGLITRKTDPLELRSNILMLTDAGEALLSQIKTAWREVDKIIENAIGTENSDALAVLTKQLRDELGGRVPGTTLQRQRNIQTQDID